ncbi:UNVERIFIED_ORG: short-subunit dehydrogenase [Paenarthrobacter nicotinovorans]|uniref:SDR family NAD(P)-dependent oxidoreductase n=1 Tax=Paenarthrobacter histidinolovorans TaxID=43664 RepID=UPI0016695F56|nr:SDR family oxidoreductase [Paenarthrobacter histidinolovorans]GGJ37381.1 short-chain dehydrogenase [Paenarthrobacter histidinolovorans]
MTMSYSGTTALITGASSGLGAEFAQRFAARGSNLVLVARRVDRLEDLAQQLRSEHGITVTVLPMDLGHAGVGRELLNELTTRGITVDTLINNAGFGTQSPLVEEDPDVIAAEIALNVSALVDITRAFMPGMVSSGKGALVNVASTAAFQPIPGMAVYGATKAFVLSFTEAVAHETKNSGLNVLALCPGATRTEFFDVLGSDSAAVGRMQTSAQVVDTALKALDRKGTPGSVVSGWTNRVAAGIAQRLPRAVTVAIAARAVQDW